MQAYPQYRLNVLLIKYLISVMFWFYQANKLGEKKFYAGCLYQVVHLE